jgi:hypothetical protein
MSLENMQQDFKLKDILLAKGGQIVYDDLTHLDTSKNMESQIVNLKEDLLQVAFSNNIILDIGWYPSFDIKGSFHINLIKNSNWDNTPQIKQRKNHFKKWKLQRLTSIQRDLVENMQAIVVVIKNSYYEKNKFAK